MDSPSLTARLDELEVGEDQSSEEHMGDLSDSESEGHELELESMTGKGIKRLCSELLELKKVSDEDFHKNIYSNYSAFLRIFEEVGGIEREIMKMKEHVETQRMLVEDLMSSVHVDINLDNLDNGKDESVEDLELDFPSWLESRTHNILETMDTLLSERRMEEALMVLEKETKVLQKLQKEKGSLSTIISPFASAILDCRTRLTEQFTSVAEHRRVTLPELYNALLWLCRLGEPHRASIILLNFFHLQLEKSVNDLKYYESCAHGTHMLQLTKLVFSTVSQAARSFRLLFGEAPYTSGMLQWARVELEVICHSFHAYIQSNTNPSLNLGLAVETVSSSFVFCSLLEQEGLILQPDLMKLMKPCILEVLQMHVDHLRKVITLSTTTDDWILHKFFISGISGDKSFLPDKIQKLGCCQLTSSGKKFIALMQVFLNDAILLHAFHVESFILKGLTNLFDEYTMALERAITFTGHVEESDDLQIIPAQKLKQQICFLVNLSSVVYLLSTIVQNSLISTMVSSPELLTEQAEFSFLKEQDIWRQSIQEASDRLRNCFCMHFTSGIISHGDSELINSLDTCSCGHCITGSSEAWMPSFAFQELFLRLRQFHEHCKCALLIEDGMLNRLNSEIMKIIILWLSEKCQFLKNTKSHRQLLLDVQFLIEIAKSEVHVPDDLMVEALDLVATIKVELSEKGLHLNSEFPDEKWAANAAKEAIQTILETAVAKPEAKFPTVSCIDELTDSEHECIQESVYEFKVNMIDSLTLSGEDEQAAYIEDEQAASRTDTSTNKLNETIIMDGLGVEDGASISEEESGSNLDFCKTDSHLEGNDDSANLSNAAEYFEIDCTKEKDSSQERMSGDEGIGADPVDCSRRRKGGQEQSKHGSAAERFKPSKATDKPKHDQAMDSLGKNRKGKTTRPQWQ